MKFSIGGKNLFSFKGASAFEMMLSVGIILLLVGIGIILFSENLEKARIASMTQIFKKIRIASKMYYVDCGEYPSSLSELYGRYLSSSKITDHMDKRAALMRSPWDTGISLVNCKKSLKDPCCERTPPRLRDLGVVLELELMRESKKIPEPSLRRLDKTLDNGDLSSGLVFKAGNWLCIIVI